MHSLDSLVSVPSVHLCGCRPPSSHTSSCNESCWISQWINLHQEQGPALLQPIFLSPSPNRHHVPFSKSAFLKHSDETRVWMAKYKNQFFFRDLACHRSGATQKRSPSLGKDGGPPSLRQLPDLRTSYGGEQEWRTAPWTQPSGLGWSRFQLRSGGKITRRFQYAGESEQ